MNTTNAAIEVNSQSAFSWSLEGLLVFGATNLPVQAGSNEYLAVVSDIFGRADTNAVSVNVQDQAFGYDLNGNLTNDGVRVYLWDEQDRLIEVQDLQTSEVLLQNRYDGLSRRRERVQREDGVLVTNRYVYDPAGGGAGGWLVVAVLDGENEVLEQYVHGMDLSGSREGAGGIGGILSVSQSGATNHFHYDGNGNVASTTDSEGAIVSRYEYDPFGRVLLAEGPYTPRYQFSTKEFDVATGLNYYGYRYYSPELGRWLNRDPIGERGGLNLYAFVRNLPIAIIDKLGLAPFVNNCNRPIPFKPEDDLPCGVKEDKKYDCPPGMTCDVDGVYPPDGGNPIKIVDGCSAECNEVDGEGQLTIQCDDWWSWFKQWYGGGPVPDDFSDDHPDWPRPDVPSEPLPPDYNPFPG